MRIIEKHQVGKILSLIKKGIGVADWFVPTHLDIDSKPILEYRENRARNKYKMHKIGTYPLKECAQFVNKYFGIDKGGGSAWSHNYIVPYINGYEGIEKKIDLETHTFYSGPSFLNGPLLLCVILLPNEILE